MILQKAIKAISQLILAIGLLLFVYGISCHVFDTYVFRESLFLGYGILHIGLLFFLLQKIIERKSNQLPIGRYIMGVFLVCIISIAQYVLFILVITGVSR